MSDKQPTQVAPVTENRPRRWDPLAMLADMESEMDRFFDGRRPLPRFLRRPGGELTGWAPRADIFERGGEFVIKAELPGIQKEDIHVTLEDGDLVITGERRSESEVKDEQYYRSERVFGSFYRRLPLPEGVKPDQIAAEYKDGMLEVRVPKPATTESTATKIAVN